MNANAHHLSRISLGSFSYPLPKIDIPSIQVVKDGHLVSRSSDFIIYSVEAEYIEKVVEMFGPCEWNMSFIAMQDRKTLCLGQSRRITRLSYSFCLITISTWCD